MQKEMKPEEYTVSQVRDNLFILCDYRHIMGRSSNVVLMNSTSYCAQFAYRPETTVTTCQQQFDLIAAFVLFVAFHVILYGEKEASGVL